MNILFWILLGGIAGWIASLIMKSNYSHGLLTDIILGIAGSLVGDLIMNLFGFAGVTGFNFYSLVVSVIGAVVLIWIGRMVYV